MKKRSSPQVEQRMLTIGEIDRGLAKLQRRIEEVSGLVSLKYDDQKVDNAESNVHAAISEIFGESSREMEEHRYHRIWKGAQVIGMSPDYCQKCFLAGVEDTKELLRGLAQRLNEMKADLAATGGPPVYSESNIDLHHRVASVAMPLFRDEHYSQAIFEASKILVTLVKEKAPTINKDGSALMFAAFGGDNPPLRFSALNNQSEIDEQSGMGQLFAGAVMALRNPRGHEVWTDTRERAFEYIVFLSLLAKRLDELYVAPVV